MEYRQRLTEFENAVQPAISTRYSKHGAWFQSQVSQARDVRKVELVKLNVVREVQENGVLTNTCHGRPFRSHHFHGCTTVLRSLDETGLTKER